MGNQESFVKKASSTRPEPGYSGKPVGQDSFTIRLSDRLIDRLRNGPRSSRTDTQAQAPEVAQKNNIKVPVVETPRAQENTTEDIFKSNSFESLPDYLLNPYRFNYASTPSKHKFTPHGTEKCKEAEKEMAECLKSGKNCKEVLHVYEECTKV